MKNTFKNQGWVTCMLLLMFCLNTSAIWAQGNREVKGTVTDMKGEPCIGATVGVKGTSYMTVTDLEGNFMLSLPTSMKSFSVSYVGFVSQTVKLTNKNTYPIVLQEDLVKMDEVVVIGYGTSKRGNITGSVASVKSEDLEDHPTENVADLMQGMLAGVEVSTPSGAPGSDINITIRGSSSINAEDTPLYVVDGFPSDDLAGISPTDIASIEILKDASSAAIYGARGANGVVLVTTKKANPKEKLSVQFTASYSLAQLDQTIDVMSGEEWIDFRTKLNNHRYMKKFASAGATVEDDWYTRLALNGKVDRQLMNDPRWSQPNYGGLALLDWQDAFFRTGQTQNYNLSFSNSTSKSSYRASMGYFVKEGVAMCTSYKRLNFRLEAQTKLLNEKVTVGVTLVPFMSWSSGGDVNGRGGAAITALSMCPVAEGDAGYHTGAEPYSSYAWAATNVSPVALMEQTSSEGEQMRLETNAFLRFTPIKDLKFEVSGSYKYRSEYKHYFLPSSVQGNWGSTEEGQNTDATRRHRRYNTYSLRAQVNYSKEIGGHNISAMAGYSMSHSTSNQSYLGATNFADNSQLGFNMSSEDLTGAYATIGTPGRMMSFFGRLQYDYDNRYVLTATLRHDGSTKFGRNARWGTFPSFGIAYRISNEAFWPENAFMNQLKLRVSWGLNGNNSITSSAAVGTMSTVNYTFGNQLVSGYAMTNMDNVNLGWEKTDSWNFGVDMGFLRNRINLGIDAYRKLTRDMLYQVSVPAFLGLSNNKAWDNVGNIENKGVEVELSSKIFTGAFKWSAAFNIAYNKNKVLSLGENNKTLFGGYSSSNTHVYMVGEPSRSYYMYDAIGVYQTTADLYRYPTIEGQQLGDVRYRDVNNDGVINDSDRTLVGKARPDFTWGTNHRLSYKKFDFAITLTGQWGGHLYSYLGKRIDNTGGGFTGNALSKWKNMWWSEEEPGDGKTPYFLSDTTQDLYDTRWLYKSDFIKIKSITLGYTIPLASKRYVKKARINLSIANLYTWDKYDGGFSPEASTYGGKNGYDYGSYPIARSYTLGLNVYF